LGGALAHICRLTVQSTPGDAVGEHAEAAPVVPVGSDDVVHRLGAPVCTCVAS